MGDHMDRLFADWERDTSEAILREYLPDVPLLPYGITVLGPTIIRWRRTSSKEWRPVLSIRKHRSFQDQLEPMLGGAYQYCLFGWYSAPKGSELNRKVLYWLIVNLEALCQAWSRLEPQAKITRDEGSPFSYTELSADALAQAGCLVHQHGDPKAGSSLEPVYEQVEFLFGPE